MDRILLTGATGFMGGGIAQRLGSEPAKLRVLARRTSDLSSLAGLDYELAEGDLLDSESLDRALDGVTQVMHAAGWISFKKRHADAVRRVNHDGTINLMEACLRAGVQRVVYTASIFGYGYSINPADPVDESARFNAHHLLDIAYVRAKHDVESAIPSLLRRGLPLVMLYPGLALGAGDFNRSSSGAVDAWLRRRLPAVVGGGGICLMDIRDAAEAHVQALNRGRVGEKYLATGHNVTLKALFTDLCDITGRGYVPLALPAGIGRWLARAAESAGILPDFDEGQARLMAHHWWYNSDRAQAELGARFRPLKDTLRSAVAWLRDNPARGRRTS